MEALAVVALRELSGAARSRAPGAGSDAASFELTAREQGNLDEDLTLCWYFVARCIVRIVNLNSL